MSLETSVEEWPAIPAPALHDSARPNNDRLIHWLATIATALAAAVGVLLAGISAVLLGLS
jgi:hypothetical protein